MLTDLRTMLRVEMEHCHPTRKPALRRADDDAWLLASDVPQLLNPEAIASLQTRLSQLGCRTEKRNGWLFVDYHIPAPMMQEDAQTDGECACVCSILRRHSEEKSTEISELENMWIRRIVKAAEQGRGGFDRCCALLHKELAERLRLHHPLPTALLPYVRQAWIQINQKQEEKKK